MAKTAMSFRLSDPAREKLTALGDIYGNMTTALELAIDRMHREEIAMLRAWDDLDTEEQNWAVQQMAESYAR
jgi:hypothetical protein